MTAKNDTEVIYISGPMSNLPNANHPAFEEAEQMLNMLGIAWVSPRLSGNSTKGRLSEAQYMDIALANVRSCTGIYMLKGWALSDGACSEKAYAKKLKLELLFEDPADAIIARIKGDNVTEDAFTQ